jgi:polyhydroxyalkanoate synthesis regulator protein
MEWFDNAMRMFSPFATPSSGEAQSEVKPGKTEASSSDIDELKQQLDAMREQISKLAKD